jgi:hypothetical protein
LDLGCGVISPIRHFSSRLYAVGVDCFLPAIKISKMNGIHSDYIYTDILNALDSFLPESFDCVIALDLIEHLKKEEGYRLIKLMNKVAKKMIIIFTPNGYVSQDALDNNPWQIHRSGWTISEFNKIGFTVIGISGIRFLYEGRAFKYKPTWFWAILSDITQIIVKNHPEYAFQLLCYKEKH